ncbi:hypothetical protein [Microbacterium sp.]|uniref:hypothetical protein n=1 Tax=Microbacterium sp. TaxID=51671 RepID=UPI0037355D78
MTDFVAFEPSARAERAGEAVSIRPATFADAEELSVVMATRGGDIDGYREQARGLIERLPVLSVAETNRELVGYSGAQPIVIKSGRDPELAGCGAHRCSCSSSPRNRSSTAAGRG